MKIKSENTGRRGRRSKPRYMKSGKQGTQETYENKSAERSSEKNRSGKHVAQRTFNMEKQLESFLEEYESETTKKQRMKFKYQELLQNIKKEEALLEENSQAESRSSENIRTQQARNKRDEEEQLDDSKQDRNPSEFHAGNSVKAKEKTISFDLSPRHTESTPPDCPVSPKNLGMVLSKHARRTQITPKSISEMTNMVAKLLSPTSTKKEAPVVTPILRIRIEKSLDMSTHNTEQERSEIEIVCDDGSTYIEQNEGGSNRIFSFDSLGRPSLSYKSDQSFKSDQSSLNSYGSDSFSVAAYDNDQDSNACVSDFHVQYGSSQEELNSTT